MNFATGLAPSLIAPLEINRAQTELQSLRQTQQVAIRDWRVASARLAEVLLLDPATLLEPIEPPFLQVTLVPAEQSPEELMPIALQQSPRDRLAARAGRRGGAAPPPGEDAPAPAEPDRRSARPRPRGCSRPATSPPARTSSLNTNGSRLDIEVAAVWQLQNGGVGNVGRIRQRRAEQEVASIELTRIVFRVKSEVAQAVARLQTARVRVVETEEGVRQAIESADKNFIGLRETTRPAGELLRLIVRPQEVVAAIIALNTAYEQYAAAVNEYNVAQFERLPRPRPAGPVGHLARPAPPRPRPRSAPPARPLGPAGPAGRADRSPAAADRDRADRRRGDLPIIARVASSRSRPARRRVAAVDRGWPAEARRRGHDEPDRLRAPPADHRDDAGARPGAWAASSASSGCRRTSSRRSTSRSLYVIHNYGGMDPKQIEGLITNVYELFFQYINSVEHVESRSIQSMVMLKLYFQPGTDMAEATAQTVAYCNRALSVMPIGSLPPYVVRLDAGSLPVGYLVFESQTPLGRRAPGPGAVPGPADVLRPGGHLVAAAVRRQHPDDRRQRRPRPPPLLQPLAPGRRRRDRPRQLHQPLRQRDDQGPDDGRADQHAWSSTRRSCATSRSSWARTSTSATSARSPTRPTSPSATRWSTAASRSTCRWSSRPPPRR